jgi:Rieske Fe-S protein
MERRDFIRACAAAALAAPAAVDAKDLRPRFYARTRLFDGARDPVRASRLVVGRNYIFHYPFEGTPCFLINLGQPTGQKVSLRTGNGASYEWPGGVGPQRGIVAYSAICSHRLTYPTRQISFISYRDRATASPVSKPNTIHCCSEHSQYDPASGARVLNGPAPQPLSAIVLEHEVASDGLYAIGTLGGEVFNAFFSKYELRLDLDYGTGRARQRVGQQTLVTELESFCKQQVRC